MFTSFCVLVTSLRLKSSSATIVSEDAVHSSRRFFPHGNGFVRFKQFCVSATGATIRFITGCTSQQPEAFSIVAVDYEGTPAFLTPKPGSMQRRLPIGCGPSSITPVIEPLSGAEHVTVNAQPYFVPSTASAAEVLTNVAIQDLLEAEDAGFYQLSYDPTSSSTLFSVADSWETFEFVNPFARDGDSDSDSESIEEEPIEDPAEGSTGSHRLTHLIGWELWSQGPCLLCTSTNRCG
ncbi:hypothetical protein B0F90DRAFT_207656 [Multifurca ochricompacta]|uniref:Uncharacterized protein n=1 Tax=Multifurca ochricompacta TaxID=376703 RepID=A0AAD4M5S8_9AGAM|nr:hypothetical protein B0F90DRAFT_207656 [Multifurca ochricompacta]